VDNKDNLDTEATDLEDKIATGIPVIDKIRHQDQTTLATSNTASTAKS
jgi:hypothetical protein